MVPSNEAALASSYIGHLAGERRLSALTCEAYARDIAILLNLSGNTPLNQLQVHQIRRFIAQLHGKGYSGRSLARMLSAWRGFYKYLIRDHGHISNPCTGVHAPRAAKTLPRTLSPDEAAKLLEFPVDDDLMALRDKAMFELCYSSGLRLAELASSETRGSGFFRRYCTCYRQRWQDTYRALRQQGCGRAERMDKAAARSWSDPARRALFLSRYGKNISHRSIAQRLKVQALRQDIGANVHPHVLRHSFASHVLQSSGDLRAVQEMLGHASISTTQVYTHLDFQHLAKVYDAAHPRAKKNR